MVNRLGDEAAGNKGFPQTHFIGDQESALTVGVEEQPLIDILDRITLKVFQAAQDSIHVGSGWCAAHVWSLARTAAIAGQIFSNPWGNKS